VFSTTHKTLVSGFAKAKAALDSTIMKIRTEAAVRAGTDPGRLSPWILHGLRARTGASTALAYSKTRSKASARPNGAKAE
jgi:hypothetical protein